MITVDVSRHGLAAVYGIEDQARFLVDGELRGSRPAAPSTGGRVATTVEVKRRFGGHSPRALLGAEFEPGEAPRIDLHVFYGGSSSGPATCPSHLSRRPFTPALPAEFAPAVLDSFLVEEWSWPAGVLSVIYAGCDEVESSAFIFGQAAQVLGCAIASQAAGLDVESRVRELLLTW